MPDIGYYHPQLVHFAIVLCGVGVVLRVGSLLGRAAWVSPAASALLIAGGLAAWFTAQSGIDAHGPIERIPGVRDAVEHHEEWGIRARNAFLILAVVEVLGLVIKQAMAQRALRVVAALGGLGGLFALYEAGEHGGELVYEYAGGPGIRSGKPEDLTRLLVAGLYTRAMADRAAGDTAGAARLIDELARRIPDDPSLQWTLLESRIKDRGDALGALESLRGINAAADDRRTAFRKGMLMAEAYRVLGHPDSARAVLQDLDGKFPGSRAVADALASLPK